ncbi:MAG: hypothetical protein GYB66_05765 [Chloroflexi bacterium]|nr:hypothetical protein [Chloroflexota bacterium]
MSTPSLDETHVVDDALRISWYAGKSIVSYQPIKKTPDVLQKWAGAILETIRNWPDSNPYLALHDLSQPGVVLTYIGMLQNRILSISVTPESVKQVEEHIATRSGFRAKVAICVAPSFSGQLGMLFAQIEDRTPNERPIDYRVFIDRDGALRWLDMARRENQADAAE